MYQVAYIVEYKAQKTLLYLYTSKPQKFLIVQR